MSKKNNICPLSGEVCNYEKTFHITETVDRNYRSFLLCGKCAKPFFEDEKPSEIQDIESPEEETIQEINMTNPTEVLQVMMQLISDVAPEIKPKSKNSICPNCKTSLDKIAKNGELGCAKCFEFFGTNLIPFINTTEKDKKNLTFSVKKEIFNTYLQRIKLEVIQAIKNEDYEVVDKLKKQLKKTEIIRRKKEALETRLKTAMLEDDQKTAQEIEKVLFGLIDSFISSIS